jgi:hypothetical protein
MFCQPGFDFFNQHIGAHGNYLEIGVFNGNSIAGLARNHPTKTIFGIDPFLEDGCTTAHTQVEQDEFMPVQYANTQHNILGLDNITLFQVTSQEFAEMLTDEMAADMNINWVLIDGSHHYEDVINDVHLAMRLIGTKPGAVVFDDCNLSGVGQARDEFLEQYTVDKTEDLFGMHPGHIMAYWINNG